VKNIFLVLMVLSFSAINAQSCCSASGCASMMGADNFINGLRSSIGARYSVSGDRFELPSQINEQLSIDYKDIYQSIAFSGRWNAHKYLTVQAELPFVFNKRFGSENLFFTGVGDLLFGVSGMSPQIKYKKSFHVVYLSFNSYAPTGEFKRSIDTAGFSPLIQPGNGAWQFIPQIEYQFGISKFSGSIGAFYRYALRNTDELQIGGRTELWLRAAYTKKVFQNSLIPSIALVGDYFQKNKFRDNFISLSGGFVFSADAALDIRLQDLYGITIRYRQPFYQNLAKSNLTLAGNFSIQFNYFFKNLKPLK
jgi:hypothetical protein